MSVFNQYIPPKNEYILHPPMDIYFIGQVSTTAFFMQPACTMSTDFTSNRFESITQSKASITFAPTDKDIDNDRSA